MDFSLLCSPASLTTLEIQYLLNIPVNKTEATYYDPLPESSADTSNIQVVRDADIVFKAYGQDLKGDMIPKR